MEQVTISLSLDFATPLTFEQSEQLKRQVRELVESEVLEGGALAVDEDEIVDFGITFADDE